MVKIVCVEVLPFDIPLKESFHIFLGDFQSSKNVLVKVQLSNGIIGYGEGSECGFITGDIQETMLSVLRYVQPILIGQDIHGWRKILAEGRKMLSGHPSAFWALETALIDAYTQVLGVPLYAFLGGAKEQVETDITISIVTPERAKELVQAALVQGFSNFKIKVGKNLADDFARVHAVAETAPEANLRIDANQGYTPKEAVQFIQTLWQEGIGVQLLEQPVQKDDLFGLKYVCDHSPVPVVADESVFDVRHVLEVVRLRAADVINIKLAKCGGILAALDMIALAKSAGIELMLGCMLESNIGIASSVHLACGTGAFTYLDLDGHLLIENCLLAGGFTTNGAILSVDPTIAGLGIAE